MVARALSPLSASLSAASTALRSLGVLHVDEVDDDEAADVAQAELVGDLARRLEVGLAGRSLRWSVLPTKRPVLTSMAVSASVWSMTM